MPIKISQPEKTFCVPTSHDDSEWPGGNDGELVNFNTNYTNPISFLPWTGMQYNSYCNMPPAAAADGASTLKVIAVTIFSGFYNML